MMLPIRTYGLGADVSYYVEPSAEQKAFLAAAGKTYEVVAPPAGMTVNAAGEVTDATLYNLYQTDPYIQAGGNPLYRDPMSIPQPPRPVYANCAPNDIACVAGNQALDAKWNDLAALYNKAINGAAYPTAPDEYMAALAKWNAGTLVTVPTPAAGPAPGSPAAKAAAAVPQALQPLPTAGAPTATQPIQPTVAAGSGQASVVLPATSTGVPSWVWLAAAAGGAFLLFGGKR